MRVLNEHLLLCFSVAKLQKDQCTNESAELPVTNGWWGKPACLPQAKFDFLCVQAALFSHHEPQKRVNVGKFGFIQVLKAKGIMG